MANLSSGRLVWPLFGLSVATSASCGVTLLVMGIMVQTKEDWQLIWLLDPGVAPGISDVLLILGILEMGLAALALLGTHLGNRRMLLAFLGLSLALLVMMMMLGFSGAATSRSYNAHNT